MLLTWIHVDGDNNLHHHRLDDMANLLTCQVVFILSKGHALMSWHVALSYHHHLGGAG